MMRTHIALDVTDMERAIHFYEAVFGVPPLRRIAGYAQFLVETPALNLALSERSDARPAGGHSGIEVENLSAVNEVLTRVKAAGLTPEMQAQSDCCYSLQEKFWVHDPDGNRFEVFWVRKRLTEASGSESPGLCCAK